MICKIFGNFWEMSKYQLCFAVYFQAQVFLPRKRQFRLQYCYHENQCEVLKAFDHFNTPPVSPTHARAREHAYTHERTHAHSQKQKVEKFDVAPMTKASSRLCGLEVKFVNTEQYTARSIFRVGNQSSRRIDKGSQCLSKLSPVQIFDINISDCRAPLGTLYSSTWASRCGWGCHTGS